MLLLCLDIETTGLDPKTNSIIEFAAVKFNEKEIVETYQSFVNFKQEIPELIQQLTGIDSSMTENAPTFDGIKAKIQEFCGDLPIIGHNIQFDINFLEEAGLNLTGPLIDTLPLSQILIDNTMSYSLETLSAKHNKEYLPSHRALDDCLANVELFYTLINKINKLSSESAYLWEKILTNCQTESSTIFSTFLPKQKKEPEFQTLEPHTSDQNSLFVLSKSEGDYARLPDFKSLISPELFSQQIAQEFKEPERDLLLKVATKITEINPLNKGNLNLTSEDYNYLDKIIYPDYIIPKSEKPFVASHFTFFRLLKENKLPHTKELTFENVPFLEETFIRSQEKRIHIADSQTFTLARLGIFGEKLKLKKEINYNNYAILDSFEAVCDEFVEILKEINTEDTQELLRNPNKYLIWIYSGENFTPSISYMEKDVKFDLNQILTKANTDKITILEATKADMPFVIETSEKYPDANSFAFTKNMIEVIEEKFKSTTGQGLILSPNKQLISQIHKSLSQKFASGGITLYGQDITGSRGKLLENIENNENPLILACTHQFFLKNTPKMQNLQVALMTKLPMTLPNHPYYEYIKDNTNNSFMELTIPNSANNLYQICKQIQELNPALNNLTLLDNRILKTSWGNEIQNKLPQSILTSEQS